jgi:hypothetical protein
MHPDLTISMAKAHQQEIRRHAAEAQAAAKLQQPSAGHARRTLPRIQLGHPVAAIRMLIAHA